MQAAAAMQRWLAALNGRGDLALTQAALARGVVIERCGFGGQRGQVVQVIRGQPAANRWLKMTRAVCQFELAGELSGDGEPFSARYRMTALDFVGGGLWQFRLDAGGRIAWLRHQPDELPAA